MRVRSSPKSRIIALIILLFCLFSSFGVTFDQLRGTPDLTPEKFGALFAKFDFKFRGEVQSPDAFLSSRSGDCDDFSTLASTVLKEKGYTTHLITVRMPNVIHVVCYVEQSHGYLDYNSRATSALVSSGSDISQIAEQVGGSYGLLWSSASEFTFENGTKRLVKTVVSPRSQKRMLATLLK
jgi:hypothetical protein